jgi:hypothetical protein
LIKIIFHPNETYDISFNFKEPHKSHSFDIEFKITLHQKQKQQSQLPIKFIIGNIEKNIFVGFYNISNIHFYKQRKGNSSEETKLASSDIPHFIYDYSSTNFIQASNLSDISIQNCLNYNHPTIIINPFEILIFSHPIYCNGIQINYSPLPNLEKKYSDKDKYIY